MATDADTARLVEEIVGANGEADLLESGFRPGFVRCSCHRPPIDTTYIGHCSKCISGVALTATHSIKQAVVRAGRISWTDSGAWGRADAIISI